MLRQALMKFVDREPVAAVSLGLGLFGFSLPLIVPPIRQSMGFCTKQASDAFVSWLCVVVGATSCFYCSPVLWCLHDTCRAHQAAEQGCFLRKAPKYGYSAAFQEQLPCSCGNNARGFLPLMRYAFVDQVVFCLVVFPYRRRSSSFYGIPFR